MPWKKILRKGLAVYKTSPTIVRRKAELALLVVLLLAGLFFTNLIVKAAVLGPSWPMALRSLTMVSLLGLGLFLLVRGHLEAQVNLLALLCLLQCMAFFSDEVSRQFFVLCLFSMVAFAILAVRPYQKAIAFALFPGLVLTKGIYELVLVVQGSSTRDTFQQTIFTLAVFAAAIPLVHVLMRVVGREIHQNELLLGVNRALKREAGTDQLTGTWNRRHFEVLAQKMTAESLRTGRPLALGVLDLDRFKQVNDQWGHLTGDEALATLVRTVLPILRQGDSLVRWGGDEFVILCPGVGTDDTTALGEKILTAVRNNPALAGWNLGVSVGLAVWRPGEPVTELLDRADHLLYQAKEGGRNRACSEVGPEATSCRDDED